MAQDGLETQERERERPREGEEEVKRRGRAFEEMERLEEMEGNKRKRDGAFAASLTHMNIKADTHRSTQRPFLLI